MATKAPRIVIAGGGIGGIVVANELKNKAQDRVDVTVIDRKPRFQFPPSFPWVALGARVSGQVEKDLGLLGKRGIRIVHDEIMALDLPRKTVRTSESEVPFDVLVIALGAEYDPGLIPGFAASAQHMYDLDSAVRLRGTLEAFRGGTVAVGVARLPFKCPAAPYEMALLLDDAFRRQGLRERVQLEFFTPEGAPLPAAGPENGSKVLSMLEERGIGFHPRRILKEVSPGSLSFVEGEPLTFDLLVCVPPHRAPRSVVDAGLTDSSGWIPVDPGTLATRHPDVFAVGDVTAVPSPNGYVPFLPKAGVFAGGQAKVVAHNLTVQTLGKGRPQVWDGYGACFLEVARGKGAFLSGNFLATPRPTLDFRSPGAIYHTQKVLYEKYWMHHWF